MMARRQVSKPKRSSKPDPMMVLAIAAVKGGNWIIRADNDGVSPNSSACGFRWNGVGEWTSALDFNTKAKCGGGLHGQDVKNGGYLEGKRLVFCGHRGGHVVVDHNKVKVREARILLVNQLPSKLKIKGDLSLQGTAITALPEGLHVGGYLDLQGTKITKEEVPKKLKSKCVW